MTVLIVDVQKSFHTSKKVVEKIIKFVKDKNVAYLYDTISKGEANDHDMFAVMHFFFFDHVPEWDESCESSFFNQLEEDENYRYSFRPDILTKEFSFFRSWMDQGIDHDFIVSFAKFMLKNEINDSRDYTEKMDLASFLKLEGANSLDLKSLETIWSIEDMIYLPLELIDQLKSYDDLILTGGGREECLKEVELVLKIMCKSYKVFEDLTY